MRGVKVQTHLPDVNARRSHHARFVGSKEVIGAHFQLASPAVRLRSSLRPLCLGNCSYIRVPPLWYVYILKLLFIYLAIYCK